MLEDSFSFLARKAFLLYIRYTADCLITILILVKASLLTPETVNVPLKYSLNELGLRLTG